MKEKTGNIPYIIGYMIGILILLPAAVFYRQPLLSVLFVLLVLMAPASVYLSWIAAGRLKVSIGADRTEYRLPVSPTLIMRVNNPKYLPLLNCRLALSLYNMYYIYDKRDSIMFAAEARSDKNIYLPLEISGAGLIHLSADRLYITDMLHLHTWVIETDIRMDIPVFPEEYELPELKLNKVESDACDVEWSAQGEQTADIRQIRDYRPGDRLKDIHWKLAAGRDDIPVKEYEKGIELYYLLMPRLAYGTLQETLRTFYSLAGYMLGLGEVFKVAIDHAHEGVIELIRVADSDDLRVVMLKLFKEQVPDEPDDTVRDRLSVQYETHNGVVLIYGDSITEMQI